MKKPRYTLEQHDQLGRELQTMDDRLSNIRCELSGAYPQGTYVFAIKAHEALRKLRYELDNQVCKENPGNPAALDMYLRKPAENRTKHTQTKPVPE